MAERLVDDIIWDQRKALNLKKLHVSTKTPCIVKLAEQHKASNNIPTALKEDALLLHSVTTVKKIICQCANNKVDNENGKATQFSIPLGYKGLVEILSENGESTAPLKTIRQVAEAAPKSVLLRSKVTALSEVKDLSSSRSLDRGHVLGVKGTVKITKDKVTTMYLHCVDRSGLYVYLDFKTEGLFSPLAGPKNISGVHTIESIAKRFRLPLTVRVVSGKIPKEACRTPNPGVLRLLETRKEKVALFLPLSSKQLLLPVRANHEVTFIKPANMKELSRNHIFQQISDSCLSKVENYTKTIHLIVNNNDSKDSTSSLYENELFQEVDEIYPYIRRGGLPDNIGRVKSLHESHSRPLIKPYLRSTSQPLLGHRFDKASSIMSTHMVKQHTIVASPTKETTLQFQSTSGSLTLTKSDILKQFIREHMTAECKETTHSSSSDRSSGSKENIYFTLDNPEDYPYGSIVDTVHKVHTNVAVRC